MHLDTAFASRSETYFRYISQGARTPTARKCVYLSVSNMFPARKPRLCPPHHHFINIIPIRATETCVRRLVYQFRECFRGTTFDLLTLILLEVSISMCTIESGHTIFRYTLETGLRKAIPYTLSGIYTIYAPCGQEANTLRSGSRVESLRRSFAQNWPNFNNALSTWLSLNSACHRRSLTHTANCLGVFHSGRDK